ncbi:hypothetical protein [[Pseudomonas] boreopolis]|uniref:hypothetical protein n=1 Tax=Xanthomonas boreopolis TaxID=86183 RepID=UPI003D37A584
MALALIVLTLWWHIPLPLWDHIDLVPIYQAWEDGRLNSSAFWDVHDGSHFHASAYAVLLLTTWASHGRTWLDCLVSAAFLLVCAFIILRMVVRAFGDELPRRWMVFFMFLALYPGHLVNLQWGWQVAVFMSLLGAIGPVCVLTAERFSWKGNALGLMAAVVGVLGFSTALAVFPVALVLVLLRRDLNWKAKGFWTLLWLAALGGLVVFLRRGHVGEVIPAPAVEAFAMYVLNYIGSGVLHFSSKIAPTFAILATVTGIWAMVHTRLRREVWPWISFMALGYGFAILTAWGRAALFGAEHGFVGRYISFSILFWIGWFGLMLAAYRDGGKAGWVRLLLGVCVLVAVFNGLHMVNKARKTSVNADKLVVQIRETYPNFDGALLKQAYDWRAESAGERLLIWHDHGFLPLEKESRRGGHASEKE